MRAIAYFKLSDPTPDALASMEHEFKRFCTYNMHQPYQVFFTEGPSVGTVDAAFRRMVDFSGFVGQPVPGYRAGRSPPGH